MIWGAVFFTEKVSPRRVVWVAAALGRPVDKIESASTWYRRISYSRGMKRSTVVSLVTRAAGRALNAESIGAKRVFGAGSRSAVSRPARSTSVSSVVWFGLLTTTSRMVAGHAKLGGISTLSIKCTTPLLAKMSASVIVAFIAPPDSMLPVRNVYLLHASSVLRESISVPAVRSVERTVPPTTWYRSSFTSRSLLAGSVRQSNVAPSSSKAAFEGAKTVNAVSTLSVCSVLVRSAASRAAASVVSPFCPANTVTSRIAEGGSSTVSTECTTPLEFTISTSSTVALGPPGTRI
mmetsp:Transcript_9629/g.22842  ORF Transcript_9629/g.22842 Transcript_9629/m.22842 type:complete len:292 (+) Transcript_9629:759-1634(+)